MIPLVLALSGTDHHPFDRLVHWMDDAAACHPDVRFLVQHGRSTPPTVAEGTAYLEHDVMTDLMRQALVVVCHGGPGTLMDAREAGHLPLVVPRDPALGEHVDGHQQRFARMVADAGVAVHVASVEAWRREVDQAVTDGPRPRTSAAVATARDAARALLATELDALITIPRPRLALRHRNAESVGR